MTLFLLVQDVVMHLFEPKSNSCICIRSASVSYMLEHSKYLLYRSTHDSTEIIVNRSRKIERYLSQPFFVAEIFTRMQGAYVCLNETIRWFTLKLLLIMDYSLYLSCHSSYNAVHYWLGLSFHGHL